MRYPVYVPKVTEPKKKKKNPIGGHRGFLILMQEDRHVSSYSAYRLNKRGVRVIPPYHAFCKIDETSHAHIFHKYKVVHSCKLRILYTAEQR